MLKRVSLPDGQVYRGRLREGGREVAVKVQRPGVRESIALDVHILRILAAFVRRWRRLNSDLPALLDEASPSIIPQFLAPNWQCLKLSSCDPWCMLKLL